jgi:thioredoxin 1
MFTRNRLRLLGLAILLTASSSYDRIRTLAKNNMKSSQPAVFGSYSPDQISNLDPINYDSFTARKNRLVIIDFYADWCPPCKRLGPMLEKAATTNPGIVYVGKINIDQAQEFAASQGVSGIPDVRIYKDGVKVDEFKGCPSEAELLEKIATLSQGITAETSATATPRSEATIRPLDKNEMPKGMQKRGL